MQMINRAMLRALLVGTGATDDELFTLFKGLGDYSSINDVVDKSENLTHHQFIYLMHSLGMPAEHFWLIHLEPEEYKEYRLLAEIRQQLHNRNFDEVKKLLPKIPVYDRPTWDEKFIDQLIMYAETRMDEDLPHLDAIDELLDAFCITKSPKIIHDNQIGDTLLSDMEVDILVTLGRVPTRQTQQTML